MAKDGFEIDNTEFDKALVIYAQAVQKDASYICNRVALNVAIKTAEATPTADPQAIASLPKIKWWPKYIAKRLGKGYSRNQARAFSKKEIKRRSRVRGYIRSGWVPAMRLLSRLKGISKGGGLRATVRGVSQFKKPKGYAKAATPGWTVAAEIANSTPGATAHPEYLQRGMDLAAADMIQYAHKLMSDTAREHSAK